MIQDSGQIRSGIIGTGFMGQVHARAVRAAGGLVTAVVSRRPETAAAFGVDRIYRSVGDMLDDDRVDLVHVCTPNALHTEQSHEVIARGKHLICEKPLATSLADTETLAQAGRAAGIVTAVPFVYRFYASVRETRSRIQRGDAGTLRLLHGSYLQDWLSRSEDTNWRVDPAVAGASRAFADIGVHWCDLIEFASGHRITGVCARLLRVPRSGPGLTEDAAVLIFATDQGALGALTVSQVSPGRKNRLYYSIDGTDSSYEFDQEVPDSLWIGGREQNIVLPRAAHAAGRYDMVPAGHPQGYQDAFTTFMADVHSAIVTGHAPDGLPTFADGLRAAALTEAVLRSSADQQWTSVVSPSGADG